MLHLNRKEFTITFVDACPSELIHNVEDGYITIGLVNFFHIDFRNIGHISQFKNTRKERKSKTLEYLISCFDKKYIVATGIVNWNVKSIALENAKLFLKDQKIIDIQDNLNSLVKIGENELTYGHLLSLAWYSLALAMFSNTIGKICKVEGKQSAAIMLDLLPGDNIDRTRNIKTVRYLFKNTELDLYQNDAMSEFGLKQFGFGYGSREGSTKVLKKELPYVITDWIIQSFFSLVMYEKIYKDKNHQSNGLADLARFLIHNRMFDAPDALKLEI